MVIHASYAVSLELGLIQRREKHRGKNPDNGNHHEQFDYRKCVPTRPLNGRQSGCVNLAWFHWSRRMSLPRGARIASWIYSVMENCFPNRYPMLMTAIERNILDSLNELDATVKTMATANPKPNLLPLFARIESLGNELPRGTAPDLLHYMQRKSYEKARLWLQGHFDEIEKGGCSR